MINNKVAVVILNWNGRSFLEKFLPIVVEFSPDTHIVVADNQSSDDSVIFIKNNFPEVSVILNPGNDGFSKGYNLALKQIEAKYYVLLNSDVEVTENWINPIIQLMDLDEKIAACQPKILDYKNRSKFEYAGAAGGFIDKYGYPFCRGRIFNEIEEDKGQYDSATEVFWATGACMFIRAEVFWKVGGFDNDYFAHMEEIDVCWRMKNIGYKIFVEPKSIVYHVGGGTLNKLSPRKTFLNFRNNLTTLTKNAASSFLFLKILYRLILDGVAALKFLFEGNGSHVIAVLKAHGSYYAHLGSTLKKRKQMKDMPGFRDATTGVYRKNIVYWHFVKGKKHYSEL
ncbi:MAG: glycosyltransferase family 2 protein [Bacteroidota bacterium]